MPAFVCRQHPLLALANALEHGPSSSSNVELSQTETAYVINVLAPGVRIDDFDVTAKDELLTIKGQTGSRAVGQQIRLPRDADTDAATATHADGILTLTVPKRAAPVPRTIEVKIGSPEEPEAEQEAASGEAAANEAVAPAIALAEMGFTDAELVSAALSKHGNDVEAAAAALNALDEEWAASLDDLDEMGFGDRHASSLALIAHDGSVKLAVKALVAAA